MDNNKDNSGNNAIKISKNKSKNTKPLQKIKDKNKQPTLEKSVIVENKVEGKFEDNVENVKNVKNKENKNKKPIKNIYISIFLVCLILLSLLVVFKYYKNKKTQNSELGIEIIIQDDNILKNEILEKYELSEEGGVVENLSENCILEIESLKNDIQNMEKKSLYDSEYIAELEKRNLELEDILNLNKNNHSEIDLAESVELNKTKENVKVSLIQERSLNKIKAIKLTIDIENNIKNNTNYIIDLLALKNLIQENYSYDENLQKNILTLEKYEDRLIERNNIEEIFNKENLVFLEEYNILKNNNNFISKFMSNFVVVTKVANFEENSPDSFSYELSEAIYNKNYLKAFLYLEKNVEYNSYFKETINELSIFVYVNDAINEILNTLINVKINME